MTAVLGISCIRPRAPVRDTAVGLNADSARITDSTRVASTPWRAEISRISVPYWPRVVSGMRSQPVAVPETTGRPRYRGSAGALVRCTPPAPSTMR